MADNDDKVLQAARQKIAERQKRAEHMRLVRAQKTLDKMNAKIMLLEQQLRLAHVSAFAAGRPALCANAIAGPSRALQ